MSERYLIHMVCRSFQEVTLLHQEETIAFGELTDVLEDEYLLIYDTEKQTPAGTVPSEGTDEELYEKIQAAIRDYESKGEQI